MSKMLPTIDEPMYPVTPYGSITSGKCTDGNTGSNGLPSSVLPADEIHEKTNFR